MIRKILFLTALVAIPTVASSKAEAAEYCREYTKTVSINGKAERAYGTACHRPDGSWEIVKLEGSTRARKKVRDVMYEDIEKYTSRRGYRNDNRIVIVESYSHRRPHHYNRGHHSRHGNYHRASYNSWPFGFYFGEGHSSYHKKSYGHAKKHYSKRHGRGSHHGGGHGYKKGGHKGHH